MVAMIIVAAYGNNIKWLFVVVLQGVCCGDIGVGGLFLLSCRPPCFQQYLVSASVLVFSWGYLIIQERHFFRVFFLVANSYFNLLLYLYYPLLFSFFTRFGFLQLPHTYITIVSGLVLLDLVDMLLLLNLPCIILQSFTLKIFFPTRFQPFV